MNTSAICGDERSPAAMFCVTRLSAARFAPDDLNIDGGGRAHADHGVHQAAGREEGREFWHLLRHLRVLIRAMYS